MDFLGLLKLTSQLGVGRMLVLAGKYFRAYGRDIDVEYCVRGQVSLEDRERSKELLPLLEKLSREHPDASVTSMATDLRIAIATHGFVLSERLNQSNVTRADAFDQTRVRVNDKMKHTENKPSLNTHAAGATKTKGIDMTVDGRAGARTRKPAELLEPTCKKSVIDILTSDLEELELCNKENLENALNSSSSSNVQHDKNKAAADKKALIQEIQSAAEYDFMQPSSVDDADDVTAVPSARSYNKDYAPGKNAPTSTSPLQRAFEELLDPLVPVRGHALISLRRLVEERDEETLGRRDTLLQIFKENLDHDDTYIYLAAMQGLAALADHAPQQVVPTLVHEYANLGTQAKQHMHKAEFRMKLGEVIMKTIRQLGARSNVDAVCIIPTCLAVSVCTSHVHVILMDIGEVVPAYKNQLLYSILQGAKDQDDLVRSSAVSNLAELAKMLKFSLGPNIHEVRIKTLVHWSKFVHFLGPVTGMGVCVVTRVLSLTVVDDAVCEQLDKD